jgi:hypothetical protein
MDSSTRTERRRTARMVGAVAAVLMPVAVALGDWLRETAERAAAPGADGTAGQLATVAAHRGLFGAAAWVFYAAAALTPAAVLCLWSLAESRSPRWSWAGGVLGGCFAAGQVVHLYGYFGALLAFTAPGTDRAAAATLLDSWDQDVFSSFVFLPFLVGLVLWPVVSAVALLRSGLLRWWNLGLVVLADLATFATTGRWSSSVWAALLLAGLAPALWDALTGRTTGVRTRSGHPETDRAVESWTGA